MWIVPSFGTCSTCRDTKLALFSRSFILYPTVFNLNYYFWDYAWIMDFVHLIDHFQLLFFNILIFVKVSICLSLPLAYFRNLETFYDKNDENPIKYCMSSQIVETTQINLFFMEMNLNQLFTLYPILISYVLPLLTIIICYLIMIKKLSTEQPNVSFFKNFIYLGHI